MTLPTTTMMMMRALLLRMMRMMMTIPPVVVSRATAGVDLPMRTARKIGTMASVTRS
jgi:hypothetical protein